MKHWDHSLKNPLSMFSPATLLEEILAGTSSVYINDANAKRAE
jgi:hypothetical protein